MIVLDVLEAIVDAFVYATWSPPWSRARRAARKSRR